MDTYRYKEHCGPNSDDHLNYRNLKEIKFWNKKCPLIYARKLLNKKYSQNKIFDIEKNIEKFVLKQFDFAEKDILPNYKEASKHVYA